MASRILWRRPKAGWYERPRSGLMASIELPLTLLQKTVMAARHLRQCNLCELRLAYVTRADLARRLKESGLE